MKVFSSSKAGFLGMVFSFLFLILVILLGFLQPTYNHLEHTASQLVFGRFGFIQQINFILIALSLFFIGYGLGLSLYKKIINPITTFFTLGAFGSFGILIFPTDQASNGDWLTFSAMSPTGRIHYWITLIMLFAVSMVMYFVVLTMKKHYFWKKYANYTFFVLKSNSFFGLLWFYLTGIGYIASWRGIYQKALLLNVLIWLMIIGFNLWRNHEDIEGNDLVYK